MQLFCSLRKRQLSARADFYESMWPMRDHPDLDTKPSKNPFDRYPVGAARVKAGTEVSEYFFVAEIDLPNDDLGPLAPPPRRSESGARARLAELGLNNDEIEVRIQWARKWMATITVPAGQQPSFLPL
jgi:hypothetical protein